MTQNELFTFVVTLLQWNLIMVRYIFVIGYIAEDKIASTSDSGC